MNDIKYQNNNYKNPVISGFLSSTSILNNGRNTVRISMKVTYLLNFVMIFTHIQTIKNYNKY